LSPESVGTTPNQVVGEEERKEDEHGKNIEERETLPPRRVVG